MPDCQAVEPEYPAAERQSVQLFALQFSKLLLDSDLLRLDSDAVLLVLFIAAREDRLKYETAPQFWRAEILGRFGWKSPKQFDRAVGRAIEAGLLHYKPGDRTTPGSFWVLEPSWMNLDPFRKRNGKPLIRSESGTANRSICSENGTGSGTANGTLSTPITNYLLKSAPKGKKRKSVSFQKPTLAEVEDYCRERENGIDAQYWLDHYEANGWRVGRTPMKDWHATVRKWEKNEFKKSKPEPIRQDLAAIANQRNRNR